jgi:hypothetical protein
MCKETVLPDYSTLMRNPFLLPVFLDLKVGLELLLITNNFFGTPPT